MRIHIVAEALAMSAVAVQAQRPSADPQTPNQPPAATQTDTRAASAQGQAPR